MARTSSAGALAPRVGRHLRLAWPALVVFLAQRLLTIAFVAHAGALPRLVERWDAGWYLRLAEGGYVYPNLAPDGHERASNLAYFPLFGWLVHQVAALTGLAPREVIVPVAWVGGLLGAWAVFAVGNALHGRATGLALSALWGAAPASLALTMGYPEGWFTAAAAATLFFLLRRRPVAAGLSAAVAGLLRPSAVAVVAAVGVYVLLALLDWAVRLRRGRSAQDEEGAGFPWRALLGGALALTGLGGFMAYVGVRTGDPLGYFAVQAQWGQQTATPTAYLRAFETGLFGQPAHPSALLPLTLVASLAYVVLFVLLVGTAVADRRLVTGCVYAAVLLVVSLSHVTFQHVYARQLLPGFVLLLPLARLRVPRFAGIAALTVLSVLMAWGSTQFLLEPTAGM